MTDEPKPCPFCGGTPVFPEPKDVFGTCYDVECCEVASINLQIIDCFDWPRQKVHTSWDNQSCQYGLEYIEVARQQAIKLWNTRPIEDALREEVELLSQQLP